MRRNWKKASVGLLSVGLFLLCQLLTSLDITRAAVYGVTVYNALMGNILSLEEIQQQAAELVQHGVLVISVIANVVFLVTALVLANVQGMKAADEVRLKKLSGRFWLLCFLFGIGLNLFFSIALDLIPFPRHWIEAQQDHSPAFELDQLGVYLLAVVVMAPLTEEICFRALCYLPFSRAMRRWTAILLSALLFGACHGSLLALFYTVPLGILLCLVLDRCGSLWAAIALHAGFNFCSVLLSLISGGVSNGAAFAILGLGVVLSAAMALLLFRGDRGAQTAAPAFQGQPFQPQGQPFQPQGAYPFPPAQAPRPQAQVPAAQVQSAGFPAPLNGAVNDPPYGANYRSENTQDVRR